MTAPSIAQKIKRTGAGTYSVPSQTVAGRRYHIDLNEKSCQCMSFRHRGTCIHLRQAEEHRHEVTIRQARALPDVVIDELAAKYEEQGRLELSELLYSEIRRRGAEYSSSREQMMREVFA